MKTKDVTERKETTPLVIPVELDLSDAELVEAFRRLPSTRQDELLGKLRALREPFLRKVSANSLFDLTASVSLGGDALADTEALYDGNGGC
jgi:hypothetical protein